MLWEISEDHTMREHTVLSCLEVDDDDEEKDHDFDCDDDIE